MHNARGYLDRNELHNGLFLCMLIFTTEDTLNILEVQFERARDILDRNVVWHNRRLSTFKGTST